MPFPVTPTYTPSNTPTPSITASVTPTQSPTGTSCPGVTPTMTPSNTPTISVTPSNTPTISVTQSNTPTQTPTSTIGSTPTQTPSHTPTPSVTPHNGIWTVSNYDCGLGTVNDVGINGNFMGSLPLGPSTFPLTSTLGGSRQNPNGVVNGLNTIQVNHSTNLQGTGNCIAVYIYVNQTSVPDYADYSLSSSPITIINNVNLLTTDDVLVQVQCYVGPCP